MTDLQENLTTKSGSRGILLGYKKDEPVFIYLKSYAKKNNNLNAIIIGKPESGKGYCLKERS